MTAVQERLICRHVWQPLVRWYHWTNVLGMSLLAIAGFHTGSPFVNVTRLPFPYITAIVQFTHFNLTPSFPSLFSCDSTGPSWATAWPGGLECFR
jgi:Ni,Fe-hydrogenase I cytochrome b subunit